MGPLPPLPIDIKELVDQSMGTMKKLPPNRRLFSPVSSPMGLSRSMSTSFSSEPGSHEAGGMPTKPPKPPRGDIFAYTMLAKPTRHKKRRPSQKAATAAAEVCANEEAETYVDPFTDWKRSVVDKNKMSLTQLKMQTDEGRMELSKHLKQEAKIFKNVDLRAMDALNPGRLYENRTFYTKSGRWATEVGRRREEAWNRKYHPPSQREVSRLEAEKELFEHYSVTLKRGSTEPTLKDLRRLLHASYEASEVVKEQRRNEAQENMKEEERQRRSMEVEQDLVRKQSLHGLKLGRPGESMLSFG